MRKRQLLNVLKSTGINKTYHIFTALLYLQGNMFKEEKEKIFEKFRKEVSLNLV